VPETPLDLEILLDGKQLGKVGAQRISPPSTSYTGKILKKSTRIIDYHLKGCMVEQKCKNNITGSYPRKAV